MYMCPYTYPHHYTNNVYAIPTTRPIDYSLYEPLRLMELDKSKWIIRINNSLFLFERLVNCLNRFGLWNIYHGVRLLMG